MAISPKFGSSSISMREVIIISILKGFGQKKHFFEGWFWFKFNDLWLALGTSLQFYTGADKVLKLKFIKFWGLIPTFVENLFPFMEKLAGGVFGKKIDWYYCISWISLKFGFTFTGISQVQSFVDTLYIYCGKV